MNHYRHNQSLAMTDSPLVLNVIRGLRQSSSIPQSDMSDELYTWLDNQLEKLSSMRLAEILHRKNEGGFANSCLAHAAKQELIRRGDYELSRSWKFVANN